MEDLTKKFEAAGKNIKSKEEEKLDELCEVCNEIMAHEQDFIMWLNNFNAGLKSRVIDIERDASELMDRKLIATIANPRMGIKISQSKAVAVGKFDDCFLDFETACYYDLSSGCLILFIDRHNKTAEIPFKNSSSLKDLKYDNDAIDGLISAAGVFNRNIDKFEQDLTEYFNYKLNRK